MLLSTKGRFAVMAMIDVALQGNSGPVPLNDIALRQHVSLSYLEQLFSKLRLKGLVTSIRGPGGGYALGGCMEGITVADILRAVEDGPTGTKHHVASSVQEMTQDLWDAMNAKVLHFTQSVTLQSLVLDQLAIGLENGQKQVPNRGVFKRTLQPSPSPNVPNSVFALGRTSPTHR